MKRKKRIVRLGGRQGLGDEVQITPFVSTRKYADQDLDHPDCSYVENKRSQNAPTQIDRDYRIHGASI